MSSGELELARRCPIAARSSAGAMQGRTWLIGGEVEVTSEGGNGGAADSGVSRARECWGGIYRPRGLRVKGTAPGGGQFGLGPLADEVVALEGLGDGARAVWQRREKPRACVGLRRR